MTEFSACLLIWNRTVCIVKHCLSIGTVVFKVGPIYANRRLIVLLSECAVSDLSIATI